MARTIMLLAFVFLTVNQAQAMDCKIGPLVKKYGGSEWFVYACDDEKSIVVVSKKGNPAMPFFFIISPQNGEYSVKGEGNGDKTASKAAFFDLKELSDEDIMEIIKEAMDIDSNFHLPDASN